MNLAAKQELIDKSKKILSSATPGKNDLEVIRKDGKAYVSVDSEVTITRDFPRWSN